MLTSASDEYLCTAEEKFRAPKCNGICTTAGDKSNLLAYSCTPTNDTACVNISSGKYNPHLSKRNTTMLTNDKIFTGLVLVLLFALQLAGLLVNIHSTQQKYKYVVIVCMIVGGIECLVVGCVMPKGTSDVKCMMQVIGIWSLVSAGFEISNWAGTFKDRCLWCSWATINLIVLVIVQGIFIVSCVMVEIVSKAPTIQLLE